VGHAQCMIGILSSNGRTHRRHHFTFNDHRIIVKLARRNDIKVRIANGEVATQILVLLNVPAW
jgi:hypothetical protein